MRLGSQRTVGPLHLGAVDAVIRTDDDAFASAAEEVFQDLAHAPPAPSAPLFVFEALRHDEPTLHWSITRDGAPCELELRDDAVLPHLQWEFNRLVIESNQTAIHAAAVVGHGVAALFLGRSHSGKTTLAGWLAAHGRFEFLADEVAVIDDELRVAPFLRPLGVRDDGPLAALTPPQAEPGGTAAEGSSGERLVPASRLGAVLHLRPTAAGLLVFPRFSAGGAPLATPLSQADALERLASLTPGLAQHGAPVFERLTRLVAVAPAIEIVHGDVREASALVAAAWPSGTVCP